MKENTPKSKASPSAQASTPFFDKSKTNGFFSVSPKTESSSSESTTLQAKFEGSEEEETLQRKEGQGGNSQAAQNATSKGNGNLLPTKVQSKMENAMGHDFSNVNIHKDAQSAVDVGALAYAKGNDVHFAPGQFEPDTRSGQELIGHELAHVVQQREGRVRPTKKLGKAMMNDDAALEKEADDMGRLAAQGKFSAQGKSKSFSVSSPSIQRAVTYPWHGMISSRKKAALRNTPGKGAGTLLMKLRRTTRVMVISASTDWLEVKVTVDGIVQTGFVHKSSISPIGAVADENDDSRRETTAFGDYNVYPDTDSRSGLGVNELYEAEFKKLKTAWERVNDNLGGLEILGAPADVAQMRRMIGREMGKSLTFRNLIIEITEDAPLVVTVKAGRDNAYFVDDFGDKSSDLKDTELFDESPRKNYEWAPTQGEITAHWLAERRHEAKHGGGFNNSHIEPMASGGIQEQYRADIGLSGRITKQDEQKPFPYLSDLETTDNIGNIHRIGADSSGGDFVPYKIEYLPKTPTEAVPIETRYNNIIADLISTSGMEEGVRLVFKSTRGRTLQAKKDISVAESMNIKKRLENLIPTGSSITIEIYKENTSSGIFGIDMYGGINDALSEGFGLDSDVFVADLDTTKETLIGTLNWAHPFNADSLSITVGGVNYSLDVKLVMDP